MKIGKHRNTRLVALMTSLFITQASAQYEIPKYSINSGSTTMQGADFEMKSSVGQVDAGEKLSGQQFELTGGFWVGIETQQNNDLIFKDDFE